jgi:sugar phosphate isomerase/epimerase
MDYIGFSIYPKLFMGDKQSLADINATGDDPEAIFPAMATTLDKVVEEFGARHHVGGVVHFCDIEHLFRQDLITQPWRDVERAWAARRRYPFVLGFHIPFSHEELPLAPGFIDTFQRTMTLCKDLDVESVVMHAPLIRTADIDKDFLDLMTSEPIIDAMISCNANLCWENAQDTPAYYRALDRLVAWRQRLADRLVDEGHKDLAARQLFCLDTGHLTLSLQRDGAGEDQVTRHLPEFARHVKVFHIHANDGTRDQHLVPFLDVKKHQLVEVNKKRFVANSRLAMSWVHTCLSLSKVDGRHVHLESSAPMPLEELITFYHRLYDKA